MKTMFLFLTLSETQCINYRPDLHNSQASRKKLKKELMVGIKGTLRSETTFGNWKPFKNDEKWFLFHLKSSSRSRDI